MHLHTFLNILVYTIGWLIFVLAQARNSVMSNTNGLDGWAGFKQWFEVQWTNLLVRAFFSGVFATYIIQQVATKVQDAGLGLHALEIAALGGFAANALLYQILGWTGLRAEVSKFVPPPNSEIVPVSKPNPNPTPGAQP